jgi:parallel beta-helix repeat protein
MKTLKSFKVPKFLHKRTKFFTSAILLIIFTEIVGRIFIFSISSDNTFFISFLYEERNNLKKIIRDFIYTKEINSEHFKNSQIFKIKESGIESFNITLSKKDHLHFQNIINQMEKNATRGEVEQFNTYRKVKLDHNGNKYDAKIKLHLGEPRHWQDPKKSYSLKLSKSQYINNMEKFDFVVPEDRGYFPPILCKELSHFTNLPHPDNDYGIVYINDEYNGVYLIEEEFDNNPAYFEKNKLPNDFSVRPEFDDISDLVLWDSNLEFWDSSAIKVNSTYQENINARFERYLSGLSSMNFKQLSKVVDVEKIAALCAINIFWGYSHDYIERNIRLVYSLDSGLIYYQPRAEDGAKLLSLDTSHYPSAERLQSFEHGMNYFYSSKCLRMFQPFLKNNQFRDKRNFYLKKIFQEYKIENKILKYSNESLQIFPLDPFSKFNNQVISFLIKDQKDKLLNNAKIIKEALSNSSLFVKIFKSDDNLTFSIIPDSLARLKITNFEIQLPRGTYTLETEKSQEIVTIRNDFESISLARFFAKEYLMADLDFRLHPRKNFFKFIISGNSFEKLREEDVSISTLNTFSDQELPSRRIHVNIIDNTTEYTRLRSLNPTDFIKKNSFLKFRCNEKELILDSGSYHLSKDLVIPEGLQVKFESNTTLTIEQNRSIISFSPINFNGTKNFPIIIKSEDSTRPFGTLAISLDKKQDIEIRNLKLIGGSNKFAGGIFFNGALSIHNANIKMDSCEIRASKGDDGINFKNSIVEISNCNFIDNYSDHMDLDFCEAIVDSTEFINQEVLNFGDAIDLSGSHALIVNNNIVKSGDKGISVGENSKVIISSNLISKNDLGIAVKDSSDALISQNSFEKNQKNLSCYRKKGFFEGGTAFLHANINLDRTSILLDDVSDFIRLSAFDYQYFSHEPEVINQTITSLLDSINPYKGK